MSLYLDLDDCLPHMPAEPGYRRNVCRLLAIALKREVFWNLPDEDLRTVSLQLAIVYDVDAPCHRPRQTRSGGR